MNFVGRMEQELAEAQAEIERLRADKEAMTYQLSHLAAESDRCQAALAEQRAAIIEECARAIDDFQEKWHNQEPYAVFWALKEMAAAIRALKR